MTFTATDAIQVKPQCLKDIDPRQDHSLPNRTFVLCAKNNFTYEERPTPDLPSENHVIVVIKATGLCGSDIHYWQHGQLGEFKVRQPLVLGHESAGVVRRCGTAVKSLQVGDKVALEPGVPCRSCSYCKTGRYNLCPDVEFAATPPHDGTLTTYYAVPEDFCYKLPDSISLEEGALVEPLSVAVHCLRLADISYGSSMLVLGAGPIGLLCCAAGRAFGAAEILATDIVLSRLDFAQQYAATKVYQMQSLSPKEEASKILSTAGMSEGFDVVIDATGVQACIGTGIHALKRGGKFVQAGLGAAEITFPIGELSSKEILYTGSFRYGPGDYDAAIKLIETGSVKVKSMITHSYSFDEAAQAFQNVAQRRGIKTIIRGVGVE